MWTKTQLKTKWFLAKHFAYEKKEKEHFKIPLSYSAQVGISILNMQENSRTNYRLSSKSCEK